MSCYVVTTRRARPTHKRFPADVEREGTVRLHEDQVEEPRISTQRRKDAKLKCLLAPPRLCVEISALSKRRQAICRFRNGRQDDRGSPAMGGAQGFRARLLSAERGDEAPDIAVDAETPRLGLEGGGRETGSPGDVPFLP